MESGGEEGARGFQQDTRLTFEEIAEKLNAALDMKLTPQEVARTLTVEGYTDSGRVAAMLVAAGGWRARRFVRRWGCAAPGLRCPWMNRP